MRLRRIIAVALLLMASLGVFSLLYRGRILYDADSYYHLAIARQIALEGLPENLDVVRFSSLREGFGDKEVLFHFLLAPFARAGTGLVGGRLALALFDALLLTILGVLAMRASGTWAVFLPLFLVLTSSELAWRLVRLRPELLAVSLLLVALWAAGEGRNRLLGIIAALFALSYTAFHAFLGIFGLLFLWRGWARRRWDFGLVLYPALGIGLGLVIHPRFPANLDIWVLQSLDYFQLKEALEVGDEIRPNFTDVALMVNLGWILGLAAIWRSRIGHGEKGGRDLADAFGVAAGVFLFLYLLMSRFSVYMIPLVSLYLLFELRARGWRPGPWVALAGGRRIRLAWALGFCLLISLPEASRQFQVFASRTHPGPDNLRVLDREQLADAIPEGGHVAAPWRATPIYMYWAPQGRYLNVLDPIFMARPYPDAYRVARSIWKGSSPDVPWALTRGLDSDYLAFSLHDPRVQSLLPRLTSDPRVETRHRSLNVLFEVVEGKNEDFVLEWTAEIAGDFSGGALPGQRASMARAYPLDPDPKGSRIEGYVDALRLGDLGGSCLVWRHSWSLETTETRRWELASYGASRLYLDGLLVIEDRKGSRAELGSGVVVEREIQAGDHEFAVWTCADRGENQHGFYFLRRSLTTPAEALR